MSPSPFKCDVSFQLLTNFVGAGPSLPVAGVTVVGVTGVRSKRITRQVQLNILINEVEFENTFLG